MADKKFSRLKSSLLSLRVSLGGAFIAIVLLTSVLLGTVLLPELHEFIRNDLRAQLREGVGVASLEIDQKAHARIRTRADESSREYASLRRQLQSFRERSRNVRFVYTFRRDDAGRVVFVVDAEEDPALRSHVGDVYPTPTPEMLSVFSPPYLPHVEKHFVTDRWGRYLSGYAPIIGADGKPFAAIGMDLSAQDAAAFEDRIQLLSVAVFLAIALLVAGVSVVMTKRISKPLTDLAQDMGRIQNFDLDTDVVIRSRIEEVVRMKTALDNMKKGLRSFKRYVPSDVVSELIKQEKEAALGAEKRPLTALFSDIEGFTTISESLPPERLSEALGVYFEGMTRAILEEGGTVDKFIGDAIMAFWGAPVSCEDHAARACRAALKCQEFLAHRFGPGRKAGEPAFRTRIGINTGIAYVGNFGFSERMSYTAIGDPINLASRLEAMNKHYGTRMLVSESALTTAGAGFLARPVDRVAVKGKKQGVLVFELLASQDEKTRAFVGSWSSAWNLYEQREWRRAAEAFSAFDDEPARILRERCAGFAANAPPSSWDGVFALTEK